MLVFKVIFLIGLQRLSSSLPAEARGRPSAMHDPSNANSLKCLQMTERCMAPLNFLRDAFIQLDFTQVSPSLVNNFCGTHLAETTACLQDIVCPFPMPHLRVITRLINWICSTKDAFIQSRPCFTSTNFKMHAKSCYRQPTMMCRPGSCPKPYTDLANCLRPHLLQDEQCSTEDVGYVTRYFQSLDIENNL